jgi:hypothetical protein
MSNNKRWLLVLALALVLITLLVGRIDNYPPAYNDPGTVEFLTGDVDSQETPVQLNMADIRNRIRITSQGAGSDNTILP